MHREAWAGGPPEADSPSKQAGVDWPLRVKLVSSRFHSNNLCHTACISDSDELSKH